jgi:hypothetical protein
MEQTQTPLEKILMVLGIFRLERETWPLDAAELQYFAQGLGKPLDFSKYHQFRFVPKSKMEVQLAKNGDTSGEFVLAAKITH